MKDLIIGRIGLDTIYMSGAMRARLFNAEAMQEHSEELEYADLCEQMMEEQARKDFAWQLKH
jgi:hypothetical protein